MQEEMPDPKEPLLQSPKSDHALPDDGWPPDPFYDIEDVPSWYIHG
jgi:hypothetical protein